MKAEEFIRKIKKRASPTAILIWSFLKKTFSDKKNLVRFALAAVALIITSQLLPGRKIEIAGFGITVFLCLSYVGLMVGAPHALSKMKLSFNIYWYGAFLIIVNMALLWIYDKILWYFETESILWIAIYSTILGVFNSIIHDLIYNEEH